MLEPLPDAILEKSIGFTDPNNSGGPFIKHLLHTNLPQSDRSNIALDLQKNYLLTHRDNKNKRVGTNVRTCKNTLSAWKKKCLSLHSLNRYHLKYDGVIPVHKLWKRYMTEYLGTDRFKKKRQKFRDNCKEVTLKLMSVDFHGAKVKVTRSSAPSLVGIEGIIVHETLKTFMIVGRDDITRTIPKKPCVFSMRLGDSSFIFHGRSFLTDSHNRSHKVDEFSLLEDL